MLGPVGAGKTATVRCIANDLGLQLKEWENGVHLREQFDEDNPVAGYYESIGNRFADFISGCSIDLNLSFRDYNRFQSTSGNKQKKVCMTYNALYAALDCAN